MKAIVNGLATEYTDEGEGPVLLLLPGWMNTIRNFQPLVSALGQHYRIIHLDLPGFVGGGTETPPEDWHVKDYAAFVQAFIEKIGLTSYSLVGHSFGGRVAIKGIAEGLLQPDRLILIASAGIAKNRTLRNRIFTLLAKVGKLLLYIPPLYLWRKPLRRKMYELLGSDYFAAGALSKIYLNAVNEDLTDDSRKITVPTLLIWGDTDTNTPIADAHRFAELIHGSVLKVFPNVGHSPHQDKAAETAQMIKEFI